MSPPLKSFGFDGNSGKVGLDTIKVRQVHCEQLAPHGGIGKFEPDVPLDAPEQRRVVIPEQVRGDDHHAVEPVKFLHEHVAVLIDRRGAAFTGGHAAGEKRVGFVKEKHRVVFLRLFESGGDVLGRVAQIL